MPSIQREEPPYLQVARHIREQILSGELTEGDPVPSARQITRDWNVAMATAMKALATLRTEGLVRAVPGKGTIVDATEGPPAWPLPSVELTEWARAYDEAIQAGTVTAEQLLEMYSAARETARTAAGVEQWLLMAAREHGIVLQDLAEIIAKHPDRDQRRAYVTGPRDRLRRLQLVHGDAAGRLADLLRAHPTSDD